MKICSFNATNFGSFAKLSLSFEEPTLAVMSGPTGAGKSTIMDCICWILYGKTAKGGSVDSIRSWNTNEITIGEITLDIDSNIVKIYRKRGTSYENDLFWTINGNEHRGKDIKESQRLLESSLLVNYDTYCQSSYFNEFSAASSFYVASKSKQKELLENIVDLSLVSRIQFRLIDLDRITNKEFSIIANKLDYNNKLYSNTLVSIDTLTKKSEEFKLEKDSKLASLKALRDEELVKRNNEEEILRYRIIAAKATSAHLQDSIKHLEFFNKDHCKECGRPIENDNSRLELLKKELLISNTNVTIYEQKYESQFENSDFVSKYDEAIKTIQSQHNQLTDLLPIYESDLQKYKKIADEATIEHMNLVRRLADITTLKKISEEVRKLLIDSSIKLIEYRINDYMSRHFDAEFRVSIENQTNDIDVRISKNGNECTYYQLSKGQRALLKLCFSLAFMQQVEHNSGKHTNVLFLDEPLDGLDVTLKLKAYNLISELSLTKSNIYVIDHSVEFQNMFLNKISVASINGISEFYEQ